jgi:hypothetical protein
MNSVRILNNKFSGKLYRAVGVFDRSWTDIANNRIRTRLKVVDTGDTFGVVPVGIKIWEGSNSAVLGNDIDSKKRRRSRFAYGIWFNENTSDNFIANNEIEKARVLACFDESTGDGTAGTANFWQGNEGRKDSPDGICGRKRHGHKHGHKNRHDRDDDDDDDDDHDD